jgi:hypothetical protein
LWIHKRQVCNAAENFAIRFREDDARQAAVICNRALIMDLTAHIQIRSSSRGLAATNLRIYLQIWQWIPTGKNAAAGTHKSTACSDFE